jgi:hypothetical protein
MFKLDTREVKQLELAFGKMSKKSIAFASKYAINAMAFESRSKSIDRINDQFIIKNKFTEKSIQVEPTKTLYMKNQKSIVGSIAPYMEKQEYGGKESSRGKHGVDIPTSASAKQRAIPRTRVTVRDKMISNIRLNLNRRKNKKQQNLINIKVGGKFVFLDLGKTKGIFSVSGSKRKRKITMIHDLSRKSIRIQKRPWLRPVVLSVAGNAQKYFDVEMERQIDRLKIKKVL